MDVLKPFIDALTKAVTHGDYDETVEVLKRRPLQRLTALKLFVKANINREGFSYAWQRHVDPVSGHTFYQYVPRFAAEKSLQRSSRSTPPSEIETEQELAEVFANETWRHRKHYVEAAKRFEIQYRQALIDALQLTKDKQLVKLLNTALAIGPFSSVVTRRGRHRRVQSPLCMPSLFER